ncbi:MAG TPA: hypothetical protein P5525_10310 [Candidatus Paceibacterota bacterium]|nr:hypothetical protein [Candidatus Paceibacterota bacterium]
MQPHAFAAVLTERDPAESTEGGLEAAVAPLVQRIAASGDESRTLAALHDALLPKPLSGEARVRVATQMTDYEEKPNMRKSL